MPTSTFFRLPDEKRQRLLDAAWEEFSRASFADASINRIIQSARIPRGSFYQYFTDKTELFWYLLEGMHEYFAGMFLTALIDSGGDMFAVWVRVFDRVISRQGNPDPALAKLICLMRMNQGMDFQQSLTQKPGQIPDRFFNHANLDQFRQKDTTFVSNVFFLMVPPLACALMETLRSPEQWELQRTNLQDRIEIIRHGALNL